MRRITQGSNQMKGSGLINTKGEVGLTNIGWWMMMVAILGNFHGEFMIEVAKTFCHDFDHDDH